MSDMTIDEATADTLVTGVEKLPASDGGAAKSVTTAQIRDFVLAALAASDAASATDLSADGIYMKQGGVTKQIAGTTLAQAVLDYACALTGIVGPNGNEIFVIDDSGTKKTITLAQLAAYVGNAADFFSSLTNAGTMAGADGIMVKQGGAVKKGTLADLAAFALSAFAAYVAAAANVETPEGTEKIAVVSGGVTKYVTLAQIAAAGGGVETPSATTQGNIPTWGDAAGGSLAAGLSVGTSIRAQGTADNTTIPTEAAVRAAIGDGNVKGPSSTTENKVPQWDGASKTLKDGLELATTVATPGVDTKVPSEKAVRTAIAGAVAGLGAGDVTGPTTTTENKLPQWDSTQKKLKNGLGVATTVGSTGSDLSVPTEKAVRTAIAAEATARDVAIAAEATARDAAVAAEATARDAAIAAAAAALVAAPSTSTTQNKIPQWDSVQKKLKDGVALVPTVGSTGQDTNVPTEKAVRMAITGATVDAIMKSGTPTSGKLAKFNGGNTVTNGPDVTTSVGSTGTDTAVPTEKAVRSAITAAVSAALETAAADATSKANAAQSAASAAVGAKVSAPVSHTENAIPTWGAANELKAGKTVTTTLASNGSNDKIPTEKAVRDAMPVAATISTAGLMTATDKQKLDNLVDTSAVPEIGDTGLADADMVTVLQGGTTWKKSLMTRFWNYIKGKLSTFKIDDLAAGEDNTDLDANTVRHGLCPKMSGDTTQFLRGDGAFATPEGSEAFTGDAGTGGTAGLVPAPAGGDAAENKFLCANGAWVVPPSAAGLNITDLTPIAGGADGEDMFFCFDASASAYRKVSLAQVLALAAAKVRYDTIFIPAGAMIPGATAPATAGAVTFTNVKHDTMAFNATASQTAEFDLALPDGWDGGAVKAKFLWTAYDATKAERGEAVKWQLGCTATADEGAITVAPTAWVDKTDTLSQVNELHRTTATAALTPEETVETGGLLHFTVRRDNSEGAVSGAPLDTDALLLGVLIQYGKTENVAQW